MFWKIGAAGCLGRMKKNLGLYLPDDYKPCSFFPIPLSHSLGHMPLTSKCSHQNQGGEFNPGIAFTGARVAFQFVINAESLMLQVTHILQVFTNSNPVSCLEQEKYVGKRGNGCSSRDTCVYHRRNLEGKRRGT